MNVHTDILNKVVQELDFEPNLGELDRIVDEVEETTFTIKSTDKNFTKLLIELLGVNIKQMSRSLRNPNSIDEPMNLLGIGARVSEHGDYERILEDFKASERA